MDVLKVAKVRRWAADGTARHLRLQANLSLREIGEAVGASPGAVLHWERAERRPSGDAALLYLELLEGLAALQPDPTVVAS